MSSSRRPAKKLSRARGQAPRARAAASKPVQKAQQKPAPKVEVRRLELPTPRPLPAKPAVPAPRPGIRLAGSASSRLTIKPSPTTGPRPQLQLSTKVRPGGPRPLSQVELDEDEVLIDGFDALLREEKVRVTAVLERTCVYVDKGGDRKLARKEDLVVEADKLPIRRRGLS
ncbi:MAG: hypothetical protein E6I72_01950 [Chloroflexi bacterium]|nr:MAG: hypothetical protein E6I72_01950 [Chloroflexota bacterium]